MVKPDLSRLFGLGGERRPRQEEISMIPVEGITFNPYQPRMDFDERGLEELSRSIAEHGVIQPVILRERGSGYELVTGERRLRAVLLLGREKIPGVIRSVSDAEMAEMALIENLQRKNLNFLEEARGYQTLIENFDLTQQQLAERIGKSQSTIANKLRLLRLPEELKEKIQSEGISERHARALLRLEEPGLQLEIADRITSDELTVRETERLVEDYLEGERTRRRARSLVGAYKDIRLFQNAIRDTINQIKRAGLEPDVDEVDNKDYIEIKIRLPKTAKG